MVVIVDCLREGVIMLVDYVRDTVDILNIVLALG